jgi:hypothetical protein
MQHVNNRPNPPARFVNESHNYSIQHFYVVKWVLGKEIIYMLYITVHKMLKIMNSR